MSDITATRPRGRPATLQRDATMRYIFKKNLWDAIALQCQITPNAVRAWKRVPSAHVISVEMAIGRPRRLIRPDLFPEETTEPRS
jgi:hypothetical protein